MKELDNILQRASDSFKNARGSLLRGAALLHRISEEKLYLGHYSSFNEYVEESCQISPGYASKLIKSYEYYVVQGGVSPRNLENVDPEKLYLAISLPGSNTDDKLLKAEKWTRQEIRDQLASGPDGDCTHKIVVPHYKCNGCGTWINVK